MARTTNALVEGIIEVDSAISLTPFISAANLLVTQCCTDLTDDYTVDQLQQIETWLSAHFYAIRDPRTTEERAGTVSERFESKVDLGFDITRYGQMAMLLDFHGGLAALNQKIKKGNFKIPSLNYIGKDRDEVDADD